jgi:hypothetical protein
MEAVGFGGHLASLVNLQHMDPIFFSSVIRLVLFEGQWAVLFRAKLTPPATLLPQLALSVPVGLGSGQSREDAKSAFTAVDGGQDTSSFSVWSFNCFQKDFSGAGVEVSQGADHASATKARTMVKVRPRIDIFLSSFLFFSFSPERKSKAAEVIAQQGWRGSAEIA